MFCEMCYEIRSPAPADHHPAAAFRLGCFFGSHGDGWATFYARKGLGQQFHFLGLSLICVQHPHRRTPARSKPDRVQTGGRDAMAENEDWYGIRRGKTFGDRVAAERENADMTARRACQAAWDQTNPPCAAGRTCPNPAPTLAGRSRRFWACR